MTKASTLFLEREAARANITTAQAIEKCLKKNWYGFKAEYIKAPPMRAVQTYKDMDYVNQAGML